MPKRSSPARAITQAADLIKQARALAFAPVVSSSLAGQKEFLKVFASNKKEVAVSKQVTGLEESWNRKARENYAKASSWRSKRPRRSNSRRGSMAVTPADALPSAVAGARPARRRWAPPGARTRCSLRSVRFYSRC